MKRIANLHNILGIVITLCFIPKNGVASIIIQEPNADKCVSIEVTNSSSQYIASIKIHKINTKEISEEGEEFIKIWLDDLHTLEHIGEPALPILTQHIGLAQQTMPLARMATQFIMKLYFIQTEVQFQIG